MLQVNTDASFLFLVADSSAAPLEKPFSASFASSSSVGVSVASALSGSAHDMSGNNQWQPPAWHHHHARHVPPPSTASAHLPTSFALPSPHTIASHARSVDATPTTHSQQQSDDQRYGVSYSTSADFSHGGYAHSYQDQQRDSYYATDSHWSYPNDNHTHHHHNQHQQHGVYGKPTTDSMGLAIDPLPLRHLVVPPSGSNGNNGANVDEELYEAHMLQEALTTPHYSVRGHLGGFHHPHQLPAHAQSHQQQHMHQHHHMQPPQYSSPFVSAVLDATAPMEQQEQQHHTYMARQSSSVVTTPSEHTVPSDSDVASGSDLKSSSSGKRKRRGESAPRLCRVEGCHKGIRSRGLCKAHGGGRRCMTPGCTTSDQGGGHCVLHGGGRRCTIENCTKSAQWKGLCKMHGGARRCRYQNCTKNGQVKAGYCRAHHNLISKQREQGIVEA